MKGRTTFERVDATDGVGPTRFQFTLGRDGSTFTLAEGELPAELARMHDLVEYLEGKWKEAMEHERKATDRERELFRKVEKVVAYGTTAYTLKIAIDRMLRLYTEMRNQALEMMDARDRWRAIANGEVEP